MTLQCHRNQCIDATDLPPALPVPHHSPPHPRPGPGNPASPVDLNDKLNNPNKFLIIVALQCLVMEKKDNMNLEMFIIISNITSLNLCDTKEPLTQSVPVILPSCGNFSYDIISTPS